MCANPTDAFDGTEWSNGKYHDMTSKTIFHVVKSFLTRMRQRRAALLIEDCTGSMMNCKVPSCETWIAAGKYSCKKCDISAVVHVALTARLNVLSRSLGDIY